MIDDTWNPFHVKHKNDVPDCEHYQVLIFSTLTKYIPSYDIHDYSSNIEESESKIDLFVFKEKDKLNQVILDAVQSGVQFVFYRVTGLGKST